MISPVNEIKDRLDIVQVISEYLQLKKVGANYKAPCPFHSEKTPSFYVSPSKQIFKCFGCGKSGSVFDFLMEIDGIEFSQALRILAKKAGVELKKESTQKLTEKERQYEICEIASKFFEKQINKTTAGKKAKEYLISRKISEDSVVDWRIGYAPDKWRSLSDFLVSRGYKREEIVKAGLAIKPEGKPGRDAYDRFRGRIMFPIFDLQGNVIGFGGRILKQNNIKKEQMGAKYINISNTLIYDKSRALYGLNKAKIEIKKNDKVVLVEGYTDVILSCQADVKSIVSSSGTALTSQQLMILSRYTKNLFLCFDMDIAGETATKKGIDLAMAQGFSVKIVSLPSGYDPADLAKDSPEEWKKAVSQAKDIVSFYFKKLFEKFDRKDPEGKKKISEQIIPIIAKIQNRIEQAHWVKKLGDEINVKEEIVWEELKKKSLDYGFRNHENQQLNNQQLKIKKNKKSNKRRLEERMLMLLLKFPCKAKSIKEVPKLSFKNGNDILKSIFEKEKTSKDLDAFVSELEFQFDVGEEKLTEAEIEEEIDFCVLKLKEIGRERKIREMIEEIKEAEKNYDNQKVNKIIEKLNKYNLEYENKN